MMLELSTKDDEDVWIRAGVAAFLSLRYWNNRIIIKKKYYKYIYIFFNFSMDELDGLKRKF